MGLNNLNVSNNTEQQDLFVKSYSSYKHRAGLSELWHCDVEPGAGTNRAYGVDTAGL